MKENRYKRKKKKSFKLILFGGLFFCLLGGVIYFAVWHDFLWIEEIEFRDSPSVPEELSLNVQKNLEEKIWGFIPQKSIILAPINKIKNDILNSFPEIKEVVVYRKLPNILKITIQERKMIGIWCQYQQTTDNEQETIDNEQEAKIDSDLEIATTSLSELVPNNEIREIDKCFYIDKEGIIFKESPLIKGSLILNIYGFKKEPVELRDNVVFPEMMDFILSVKDGLPKIKTANGLFLETDDFEIVSIEDLRVTSFDGWQIYFNPSYSVDSQLEALKMVLQEEIKQDHAFLEYIDLRIQGRVYYK